MKLSRFLLILIVIPVLALAFRRDPGTIMSIDELRQCLEDSLISERKRGTIQLVGLSKKYRETMVQALNSPYQDVRLAGINALSAIGDQHSIELLTEYLLEVRDNRFLLIGTAEALSRMKAHTAIPLITEILSTNEDEYVQKYLSRAIQRIETPNSYSPLFEEHFTYIKINFLVEDLKSIRFEDVTDQKYKKHHPYYFSRDDWPHIFKLLLNSEIVTGHSVPFSRKLIVELSDGRTAKIYEHKGKFFYMNDSFFHHSNNECLLFKNVELSDFIKETCIKD